VSILDKANKHITVPKNAAGIKLCEYGGATDNDNLVTTSITQNRLDTIWDTGIVDKINVECDLLIDDFESERIEGDNIDKCLSILSNEFDELKVALEYAKQFDTFVDLDF